MPLNVKPFAKAKNVFLNCDKLKTIVFDSYFNENLKIEEEEKNEEIKKDKETLKLKEIIQNLESYSNINDEFVRFEWQKTKDFAYSYLLSQTSYVCCFY